MGERGAAITIPPRPVVFQCRWRPSTAQTEPSVRPGRRHRVTIQPSLFGACCRPRHERPARRPPRARGRIHAPPSCRSGGSIGRASAPKGFRGHRLLALTGSQPIAIGGAGPRRNRSSGIRRCASSSLACVSPSLRSRIERRTPTRFGGARRYRDENAPCLDIVDGDAAARASWGVHEEVIDEKVTARSSIHLHAWPVPSRAQHGPMRVPRFPAGPGRGMACPVWRPAAMSEPRPGHRKNTTCWAVKTESRAP